MEEPVANGQRLAAMEPRPDGGGKVQIVCVRIRLLDAAMEPRPDGRGKPVIGLLSPVDQALPQWSPGLMAGGRCSCTVRRQGGHCRNGAPA